MKINLKALKKLFPEKYASKPAKKLEAKSAKQSKLPTTKPKPKSAKSAEVTASTTPAPQSRATPTTTPAQDAKVLAGSQSGVNSSTKGVEKLEGSLQSTKQSNLSKSIPTSSGVTGKSGKTLTPAPTMTASSSEVSPQVRKLANAADRLGMYATDVIRFPELLTQFKLDEAMAHHHGAAVEADRYNREYSVRLMRRKDALNERRGLTETIVG